MPELVPVGPDDASWQTLPMRHADPLQVHTLREDGDTAVLLAHFSQGWGRDSPVTCTAAEDFVVLRGTLEVNGCVLGPGAVAHVPAGAVRLATSTIEGCTAVAWFVGRLRWEDALPSTPPGELATWHPGDDLDATSWSTPLAAWSFQVPGPPAGDRVGHRAAGDSVDLDAPAWAPPGQQSLHPATHRVLVRTATVS